MRSSPPSSPSLRHLLILATVVALGASVTGCGTSASPSPTPAVPTISGAWVRVPMGPDRPAAGYLTITNPGGVADSLVGASSDAAMTVEIHETTTDASGMSGMHPIDRLEIPAGGTVTLGPGGYHLMLMGPTDDVVAGATIELRLEFEVAGEIVIDVEVREASM